MSDRLVRQVVPAPADGNEAAKRFSEYIDTPNIVLIGDPGSGKSHLFEEFAGLAQATVQSTRVFLNSTTSSRSMTLFIDALDEKRAGRSDSATIDLVAQKLSQVTPSRVRIACREHDWLGSTDLEALRPYFTQAGGFVVLSLQALTDVEQHALLLRQGILDPSKFIRDAENRDLADLLVNPQNLIMLAEAVLKDKWPTTRRDLFERTTRILLHEHNLVRSRTGEGRFAVAEVRPPAGASCALRLISDVDGISLLESASNPHLPSYRTIPFAKPKMTLAALGRRVFRSLGDEAVDYSHRINAEYAGAEWLAQQIRRGLPLSRVRAILGVDGVPSAELRGLHAWLAVLLPEHATALIEADPFGVLIYGDAVSLSHGLRVELLSALGRLAEGDPFFRAEREVGGGEQRVSAALAALRKPDMVPQLGAVLRSANAPFGFKLLVLDALRVGEPLEGLQNEVVALLTDKSAPYGLKSAALSAAVGMGSRVTNSVAKLYQELGGTADDIRLRADILSRLFARVFEPKDVVGLFADVASCDEELLTGVLWSVPMAIPSQQIPMVLDTLPTVSFSDAPRRRKNRRQLERFVERLIVRALEERSNDVTGSMLWRWLGIRTGMNASYDTSQIEDIRSALQHRSDLLGSLFQKALDEYQPDTPIWIFIRRITPWFPLQLNAEPLQWLVNRLIAAPDSREKQAAFYELAIGLSVTQPNRATFERLFFLAEDDPKLASIRDRVLVSNVEEWQRDEARRRASFRDEQAEGRQKSLEEFAKNIQEIRTGTHLGWLIWGAEVYFARFSDSDGTKQPRERLEEEIGSENTATLLAGLKTLVRQGSMPTIAEISNAEKDNSYPRLWLAFIAGMDEVWLESPSVDGISDEVLRSLLALELIMPTESRPQGNTVSRDIHDWKVYLEKQRPDLFESAYLALARDGLSNGLSHVSGLYELLNDEAFRERRSTRAVQLLKDFPDAPRERLEELLRVALSTTAGREIPEIFKARTSRSAPIGDAQRRLWTAAAYLVDPDGFETDLDAVSQGAPAVVWEIRALTGYDRRNSVPMHRLSVRQIDKLIRIVAMHFSNAPHPRSAWSGDENAWDAAEFVKSLIAALSAAKGPEATESLLRLQGLEDLKSYANELKHALTNQQARFREMAYQQPGWEQTIQALSNGPPANVADLQALVIEHLTDINLRIGGQNTDIYKQFWNEDSHGRPTDQKNEESARDVLLELLRVPLARLGISAEPEVHMVTDKRADIVVTFASQKLILELKRDTHSDLWTAHETQLESFYVRDPAASGFGIYGVFWYGAHRVGAIPKLKSDVAAPRTAAELSAMLKEAIAAQHGAKLQVVVIDVSVPLGGKVGQPKTKNAKAKVSAKQGKSEGRSNKKSGGIKSTSPERGSKGKAKEIGRRPKVGPVETKFKGSKRDRGR
jgi:energy-coupling factor transporter ATP-binding protein EcfA2